MSRRYSHPPRHERPHEQRLREIVDELVPDDSRKQTYLSFAWELAMAGRQARLTTDERRWTQIRGSERTPALRAGNWKLETATTRNPPFPDYGPRTKRIVAKWFKRGLSGHLLWLIGEAVLREQEW